jgi:hypothetical protein
MAADVLQAERRMRRTDEWLSASALGRALDAVRLGRPMRKALFVTRLSRVLLRHFSPRRLLKGRGLGKVWHGAAVTAAPLLGGRSRDVMRRHTKVQGRLQVLVLPFEDDQVLETERLERCPTQHAYIDPETDELKFAPICAWRLHHNRVLRAVAERYAPSPT